MKTNDKKILVIGGAGFIGSACIHILSQKGFKCTIFDNMESGNSNTLKAPLIVGDIRNKHELRTAFESQRFDAVLHLAAKIKPTESIAMPELYYEVNTQGSINVGEEMINHGVSELIFSSTAAVYGEHENALNEETMCVPTTPYGQTKKWAENKFLEWHSKQVLNVSILRFFNAAGAMPEANIGETHTPEIHLIPKIIRSIKDKTIFEIYGNKHPTKDGTCIRDYVHVKDIAEAHSLLISRHFSGLSGDVFNVGTGNGHTVLEVYNEIISQMKCHANFNIEPKREGDPSILITKNEKLRQTLKWEPKHSKLKDIVSDAIQWSNRITS